MIPNDIRDPGPLLKIKDLTIAYQLDREPIEVLRGVSLEVNKGQMIGIVGESGSGKTTLALAILGYLPESGLVCKGSISFNGQSLLNLNNQDKQKIWGTQIAFVPQDALSSLNPTLSVGEQLLEGQLYHSNSSRENARRQSLELLRMVRIPDPKGISQSYPHQISGGMQQRVMIAIALSLNPQLLVLDEPTTNLDMTTQAVILDLVRDLVRERETAVIYVTHNLGVVSQICDRVAVLYAGELIEDGPTSEVYSAPLHPYTRGLLDSLPRVGETKQHSPLRIIAGRIPDPEHRHHGCIFLPRCPIAIDICKERPPLFQATNDQRTRCFRWQDIADQKVKPVQPHPKFTYPERSTELSQPVLRLDNVKVHYASQRTIQDRLQGRLTKSIRAVNGIDIEIPHGQTLGLVGESGSGKTTLARAIIGLVQRSGGEILFRNIILPTLLEQRDFSNLRDIQMVFQNPQESLNPTLTIGQSIQRPLQRLQGLDTKDAEKKIPDLLKAVQLPRNFGGRFPSQLSGGEIQRAAIARAFASNPKLLLADEPVSALDVSIQASILNLLMQLQAENETAILLISHDIAAVGYLADIVAVIYLGKLMEITDAWDLFTPPLHPYTEALISAIPSIEGEKLPTPIRLDGEVPSPAKIPVGCPFHTRCPRILGEICQREEPAWQELTSGKRIYCHILSDELQRLQNPDVLLNQFKGKQTQ